MTLRSPMTEAEKELIAERKASGCSLQEIADELVCSYWTVRKWWRQQRDGKTVRQRGRPASGTLSTYPVELRDKAIMIKKAHPHWGPINVCLELQLAYGYQAEALPSPSRLSVLFKEQCPEAVQERKMQVYREKAPPPITRPHQRWQMDGKEAVRLGDSEYVTVLDIRDPAGALMIASQAFVTTTEKRWRKLDLVEIQNTLRQAFLEWGMPLEIHTDRENVYAGSPNVRFPSRFTLWLVGLGITHILSRSRRPTDLAHNERNHRTLGDMSWKDEYYQNLEHLQTTLDQARQRYNQHYPSHASNCQGKPPLVVHPWANHSGRPFHPNMEGQLFDLDRVDLYLASQVWTRKVSDAGFVGVGRHYYYLGLDLAGQTISVRFDPNDRSFSFEQQDGSHIKSLPAKDLDKSDLIGFVPVEQPLFAFQLPLPLGV